MERTNELVELEEKGWHALVAGRGAEFYDAFMADEAFMALPVGVLDRDTCVQAIAQAQPWAGFEMSDVRLVVLSEECAAVVYTVTAHRHGQPEYRAVMSTTYVWREDEWLIAFHQQTPIE